MACFAWLVFARDGIAAELPSFQALEAAGAVIGEIRINNQNVFDTANPKEDYALFRFANAIHIRTRPDVIRNMLLFHSGEPVSARLIEETDRVMRRNNFIYDVSIRPIAYRDGVVDIEVTTRDSWTLTPGLKLNREGGSTDSGIGLTEQNFLGTGIALGVEHRNEAERSGKEYFIERNNAFDGWTSVQLRHGDFSDGSSNGLAIIRPFYALDTRWAAGALAANNDRIDSIYNNGLITSQYRHKSKTGEIFGGLSPGLVDGRAQRYSAGLRYQDDTYANEPGLAAPAQLPVNETKAGPFVRYEVVEDDFLRVRNRNLIERTEYFALGLDARVELGRAMAAFGSTRELWEYSAEARNGWLLAGSHNLLASAYTKGLYGSGGGERQFFGTGAKYYRPQRGSGLLFASASFDTVANGNPADQFSAGGDNGLRGYPRNYQTGTHRALFSVEQRAYTDWYPFRLFRIGGAVYADYGRAWGGASQNTTHTGWLADVGFGLRILNDRSATGKVIHIDLAHPLNRDPSIKSWQFIVKSRTSF